MSNPEKIIAIVGTTGSGKTGLAVRLCRELGGEVVSADSRQVYKYMDIGTGKDLPDYFLPLGKAGHNPHSFDIVRKEGAQCLAIPYHCIDLVHPNTGFNLAKWLRAAKKAAKLIQGQSRVPIVAGGTGLYAQALLDGYELRPDGPDKQRRARLEKQSPERLFARIKRKYPAAAAKLNNSDRSNKRRLIRVLESGGRTGMNRSLTPPYNALVIGLHWPARELKARIRKRLMRRLEKEDMIGEVERLHRGHRVSWRRLMDFGLEYRWITRFLKGEVSYLAMVHELDRAIYQFSRRQQAWLRRWERQGRKIHWIRDEKEALKLSKEFLKE